MRTRKRKRPAVDAHRVVHPTRVPMHHLLRHKCPLVHLVRRLGPDRASAVVGDVCRGRGRGRVRHAVRVRVGGRNRRKGDALVR